MVTANVSTTDHDTYDLAPLQVQERHVMDTALIWFPHRKCMVKLSKLNKKYLILTLYSDQH